MDQHILLKYKKLNKLFYTFLMVLLVTLVTSSTATAAISETTRDTDGLLGFEGTLITPSGTENGLFKPVFTIPSYYTYPTTNEKNRLHWDFYLIKSDKAYENFINLNGYHGYNISGTVTYYFDIMAFDSGKSLDDALYGVFPLTYRYDSQNSRRLLENKTNFGTSTLQCVAQASDSWNIPASNTDYQYCELNSDLTQYISNATVLLNRTYSSVGFSFSLNNCPIDLLYDEPILRFGNDVNSRYYSMACYTKAIPIVEFEPRCNQDISSYSLVLSGEGTYDDPFAPSEPDDPSDPSSPSVDLSGIESGLSNINQGIDNILNYGSEEASDLSNHGTALSLLDDNLDEIQNDIIEDIGFELEDLNEVYEELDPITGNSSFQNCLTFWKDTLAAIPNKLGGIWTVIFVVPALFGLLIFVLRLK